MIGKRSDTRSDGNRSVTSTGSGARSIPRTVPASAGDRRHAGRPGRGRPWLGLGSNPRALLGLGSNPRALLGLGSNAQARLGPRPGSVPARARPGSTVRSRSAPPRPVWPPRCAQHAHSRGTNRVNGSGRGDRAVLVADLVRCVIIQAPNEALTGSRRAIVPLVSRECAWSEHPCRYRLRAWPLRPTQCGSAAGLGHFLAGSAGLARPRPDLGRSGRLVGLSPPRQLPPAATPPGTAPHRTRRSRP